MPREEHPEGWEDPRTRGTRSDGRGREDRLGSPHPGIPKAVESIQSQTSQGDLVEMSLPRATVKGERTATGHSPARRARRPPHAHPWHHPGPVGKRKLGVSTRPRTPHPECQPYSQGSLLQWWEKPGGSGM